jgi:glycosyltransferase involved in cell wall biosynthesis
MRILSIAHPAGTHPAGAQRYAPLVAEQGLDVHLLVPERWHEFGRWLRPAPQVAPGIAVHVAPVRWPRAPGVSWYLHHYPRLGRLVRGIRPDVIHLWEEPWSLVALQAVLLRRWLQPAAAIVLEVDQNILKRLPVPFEQIRRHVLRQTDHLLARSPDALEVARACGFTGTASLVGYGVDQDTFRPGDRAAARAEFDLDPDGLVIGYAGRLVVEKGLDDMLAAMACTPALVTFAMLGEGPHQAALEQAAARLGLADRVRTFPRAALAQVARFNQALDACVLLTRTTSHVREQFGRVIIEAHACGIPVIGSTCGAIPSVVGDGGWIVPERDPPALAALLTRLADAPDEMPAAGGRGAARVARHFTYAQVAGTLADAWREAAARRQQTLRRQEDRHVERGYAR